MLLTKLIPRHSSDDGLLNVTGLFITEDRELMVQGICAKCKAEVTLTQSFNDLEQNVPTNTQKFTEADKHIAHSLGVSLEDAA